MQDKNIDRVMAYHLAKEINYHELENVSGGADDSVICEITNSPTVVNGQVRMQVDGRCRW